MSIVTGGYGSGCDTIRENRDRYPVDSKEYDLILDNHKTYAGYESGAGYIEEAHCGITPPICVDIELEFPSDYDELNSLYPPGHFLFKYALTRDNCDNRTRLWFSHYNDSGVAVWTEIANGGAATVTASGVVYTSVLNIVYDEGRFYPFGVLTSFVPNYDVSNTEFRSIESDEVECMLDSHHSCQVNLSYHPTNTRRLYYTLGIPVCDTSTLTEPIDIGRCLPYQSIKNWHDNNCEGKEINFLYNMCKVKSFTVRANLNKFIDWSETIVAQKEQYSYSDVFGDITIGENAKIPCYPYAFYEGDVWITRYTEEDVSEQIVEDDQTEFVVSHAIFDFNRDGYVDANGECFFDVRVFVNQIEVEIEHVTFTSVLLVNGVDLTDTVEIRYHYIEQLYNSSSYSLTINWNTKALGTFDSIFDQDMAEGQLSITGTLTMDFQHLKEYTQYVNSRYFHIFFEQGGEVVFECLFCKWDQYKRNIQDDELVSLLTPFTASQLQIDSELRQGSLRELEEETIEPTPTPTPPGPGPGPPPPTCTKLLRETWPIGGSLLVGDFDGANTMYQVSQPVSFQEDTEVCAFSFYPIGLALSGFPWSLKLSIQTDDGFGFPTGIELTSILIDPSTLVLDWYKAVFPITVMFPAMTQRHFVFEPSPCPIWSGNTDLVELGARDPPDFFPALSSAPQCIPISGWGIEMLELIYKVWGME